MSVAKGASNRSNLSGGGGVDLPRPWCFMQKLGNLELARERVGKGSARGWRGV